jgi:O-antigen/teichoic acid export membrane protein
MKISLGETAHQAGILFSAQMGSMAMGFASSLVLARAMRPEEMGRFAFCQSVILVGGLFFEFGIASAGARVLALSRGQKEEQKALGAIIALSAISAAAFSLFILAAAAPISAIFKQDVRQLLVAVAPLAAFQPMQLAIEQSCQGLNRIRELASFQLLMSGSYLVMLIALAGAGRMTAASAMLAYLAGVGLASFWAIFRLRPRFEDLHQHIKISLTEARQYGLNIYAARITGAASAKLDGLIIAYFLGRASSGLAPLGIYAIAQKLSSPIVIMSRALAITRFRAFAKLDGVPSRMAIWNAAALAIASLGLAIIGPAALRGAFPKYAEAAPLMIPFAVWNLLAGLFQPYNIFLASHGRGREIRNIALMVALADLAGLILLMPRFGIAGAAWSTAMAMGLDYLLHLYYYRSLRSKR